jgi:hypothetical protein
MRLTNMTMSSTQGEMPETARATYGDTFSSMLVKCCRSTATPMMSAPMVSARGRFRAR